MSGPYDSILVVSFGGPERTEDVMPFLRNVVRGRNVPDERLAEVAEHYYHFGGKSPINQRTLEVVDALRDALRTRGPAIGLPELGELPVYWGNRHWHPFLKETLREMAADGAKHALAFVTSALSSYSGCRAYREDIARVRQEVEGAPVVDKIRAFYDHPGYVEVCVEALREALGHLTSAQREQAHVWFSAHSIPRSMAAGCDYEAQLRELARLVVEQVGHPRHRIVYQSRSGPPHVPWLEPDVGDALRELAATEPGAAVVAAPFGFVADHMEVIYDLDHEARAIADELGLTFVRAATANNHPRYIEMIVELIAERIDPNRPRRGLGTLGIRPDQCPVDCCLPGGRRP